uniref:Uncharacterized protein n=1 Tax=Moniliophthora roreri TaxID=221103 RepID=A0A0W0FHJ9_MONRR
MRLLSTIGLVDVTV